MRTVKMTSEMVMVRSYLRVFYLWLDTRLAYRIIERENMKYIRIRYTVVQCYHLDGMHRQWCLGI